MGSRMHFAIRFLSPSQMFSNNWLRGGAHHLLWGQGGVQAGAGSIVGMINEISQVEKFNTMSQVNAKSSVGSHQFGFFCCFVGQSKEKVQD